MDDDEEDDESFKAEEEEDDSDDEEADEEEEEEDIKGPQAKKQKINHWENHELIIFLIWKSRIFSIYI